MNFLRAAINKNKLFTTGAGIVCLTTQTGEEGTAVDAAGVNQVTLNGRCQVSTLESSPSPAIPPSSTFGSCLRSQLNLREDHHRFLFMFIVLNMLICSRIEFVK